MKDEPWLKPFLEEKFHYYNRKSFIEKDPISIPHLFSKKQDIEIAGLLAATIAWGNRKSILQNARQLMTWMDDDPHEFILNHGGSDLKPFKTFKHRTFNGSDCVFFLTSLRHIYRQYPDLESVFRETGENANLKERLIHFRTVFLKPKHLPRVEKHISDPVKKSSAKRLCMYLRWMVRKDNKGVDFGIWHSINPADLCLPLDVHSGNVARKLGLLKRPQNDWKAVEEVTEVLRGFDPKDPVKYDFALFSLGVDKLLADGASKKSLARQLAGTQ